SDCRRIVGTRYAIAQARRRCARRPVFDVNPSYALMRLFRESPPAALGLCFRGGERTLTTSERRVHACAAARGIRVNLLPRRAALRRGQTLGQWPVGDP